MPSLQEHRLVDTVTREGNRRNSETRESAFEAIPARERPGVAPRLSSRPRVWSSGLLFQQDLRIESLGGEGLCGIVVFGVHVVGFEAVMTSR